LIKINKKINKLEKNKYNINNILILENLGGGGRRG